ncbi:MAG: fibrobacter succinogenes major paralogous domain-containing protein, partial [candidate division Zixibacteria bacterium]|nr:fibrobacter succinogenes major paralogous domain-containing protein [candidate division Zixibacteria bacterium]
SFAVVCGNVDCSENEEPDISDITRLIDFLYLTHEPLCHPKVADVDNSGGDPDISDITRLIDFLYLAHTPLNCPFGTVTDIDGNVYQTITIGTQVWMAENLKVTHYREGDAIPHVTDGTTWAGLTTGAYCEYNNDVNNVAVYGRLYNWYAVIDSRNIAPEGWHVPSDEEWKQLEMYLGMSQADADITDWRGTDEGGKLKETGTIHWYSPNTGANNESGLSALPAGSRLSNGSYTNLRVGTYFQTSTEESISHYGWTRQLIFSSSQISRSCLNKRYGFSVRCVKD